MKKKSCTHLLILAIMVILLPAVIFSAPVPDTGQTQTYTNTFGEDHDYTINPHSYTDLGNGIVRDNVTGLEWQKAAPTGTYTWANAVTYCNNLVLGGKSDWRLPTIKELSALVDSSILYPGPTINTTFFPGTVASYCWSSTTYANSTSYAWFVSFNDGYVGYDDKAAGDYVRAVRGGQTTNNFVDNGNGTITDTGTGLMWQKATAPGTYTWEQAITYCENLTLPAGGYSDWRLPNRNELQSIVDYSRYNPAIDTTYFPGAVASNYWSSTTYAYNTGYAWSVSFYYGYVGNYYKTDYYYVRAVRGGQCGGFGDSDIDGICDDGDVSGVVGDNPCTGGNKVFCDDNCRTTANANQADIDADGIGDVCDTCTDVDDDGYCAQTNDCNDNNPAINPAAAEICDGVDNNCNNAIDEGLGQTTCGIGECEHTVDNCANGQVQICDPMEGAVEEICGDGLDNDCDGEVDEGCATLITLTAFDAIAKSGRVILEWATESEIDNAGFNIYRAESENGDYIKINDSLIPAQGSASRGALYEFVDTNVRNRKTYYYKLEDIDLNGTSTMHGPVSAMPRLLFWLSSVNR